MAQAKFLYDNFSTTSGLWTSTSAVTGVINGGYMRLRPTAGYDSVDSVATYSMVGSYVGFKLFQNCAIGAGSNTIGLAVGSDGGNGFEFIIEGGRTLANGATVYMRESVAGSDSDTTFTYDPDVHIWFRLREASGTIYWETSTDGTTWTTRRSKTTTLNLSAVTIAMAAGFWGSEAGTTYARIDDFNLWAGVPTLDPTSALTDTFDDMDTGKWIGYTGGAVRVLTPGGAIPGSVLYLYSSDAYYSLSSAEFYDMTDDQVAVQIVKNAEHGTGTFISELTVMEDGNPSNCVTLSWDGDGGYMYFIERVGGVEDETATAYNPLRHKWLRLREASGTVYWETSIDGILWTERRSKTTTLDLSSVSVKMGTGSWESEAGPSYIFLDNFNLNTGNDFGPDPPFKTEELVDDFTTADESKWYGFIPGFEVNDGFLEIDPSPEYEYLVSVERWDLTDSYMLFQLVQNANKGEGNWDGSGSITTELGAMVSSGNFIKLIIGGGPAGQVIMRERVGGVDDDRFFVYNPDRHKWFRIREAGGVIYWETTANGVSWTIQREKETTLDVSSVMIGWFGGFWDTEVDPGVVKIDNFNIPDLSLLSTIGWFVSSGLQGGSVDGGTVQQRNYFQKADWLWNPIPDDPVLDPLSDEIGGYLTTEDPDQHHSISMIWYGNALIHPNQITPSTPRYAVRFIGPDLHPDWWPAGSKPFTDYMVPIPYGTQVPPGSDGHLCVADPVTGKVFSFWQAFYDPDEDEWYASWGGIADLNGDGRDYAGSATATNISRYAGVVRMSEIVAGEIPHAIFVASNMCRPGEGWVSPSNPGGPPPFVYPAQKSDGRNLAEVPVEFAVVEGTRLQLNPEIDLAAIPNITPGELAMGRAWQRYGAYVGDQGGNPLPPTVGAGGMELWQGIDYTPYEEVYPGLPDVPIADEYFNAGFQWDYFGLDRIPWVGNIRVLRNWDGS